MKFIVIEGLDGAGKSTQLKLVEEFLLSKKIKSRFLHFPRTDSPVYGELISRFLRGDFGRNDEVDPYLVALLYAGDRKDASTLLRNWMDDGYVVLADRYLYSNVAFQCAKVHEMKEKQKLAQWIRNFEYEYNRIPVPDLNLFLDVPFSFTRDSLDGSRQGDDRAYLKGADDIHEADLDFQQRVREVYLWQVAENSDFELINCDDGSGTMLPPDVISGIITHKIEEKLSLTQV